MASKHDFEWVAAVGCEGGPIMVVDLPAFAQWTGAAPFAELRKVDPQKAARFADRMKTLHYWGQFTEELPEPFRAEGGHQFVQCASEDEARAKLAALVAAVKKTFPDVEISEDEEQTHFLRPGDEDDAQLWAELAPQSEYDASWQSHEDEEVWEHAFGSNARALFWEIEGAGVADVGVSKSGDEILLVRSWLSGEDETEEEEEAAVHAHAAEPHATDEAGGEVVIGSGRAVVIWSPVAPFQLEGLTGPESLAALGEAGPPPELDTEMIGGVGTVVRVEPGRYAVTYGSTDAEQGDDDDGEDDEDDEDERSWSARWCRLTRVG